MLQIEEPLQILGRTFFSGQMLTRMLIEASDVLKGGDNLYYNVFIAVTVYCLKFYFGARGVTYQTVIFPNISLIRFQISHEQFQEGRFSYTVGTNNCYTTR